jgi:hypothetical protein
LGLAILPVPTDQLVLDYPQNQQDLVDQGCQEIQLDLKNLTDLLRL